jgi:outer membrane protein TolC
LSGFAGTCAATWFGWPSLFWAAGTSLTQELFDGGRRHAQSTIARAGYNSAVASYRQTTLTAFQQVEDNLAAPRILDDEARQQREAVAALDNALRIFTNRYVGGEDAYLPVIIAQTTALANQRNDVDILRRRMEASVLLVKALGSGWNVTSLPQLTERGFRAAQSCRSNTNETVMIGSQVSPGDAETIDQIGPASSPRRSPESPSRLRGREHLY